ncbi:MAG: PilZ domain-containing protein [Terriglobales bacterium]
MICPADELAACVHLNVRGNGTQLSKERKVAIQEYGYRLPRFPADFSLVLQTTDPTPRLLDARCRDISEDGLAARVSEALAVGARVTLLLTLPGKSSSLPIAATVSHQDRGDHGFAFKFSSQNEREQVQKYVLTLRSGNFALRRSPK